MKNFKNLFVNNGKTTEQYCFVVDNQRYYRFNGKFALYEYGMLSEKKEYAERQGNTAEPKQVYGIFEGRCPDCGHMIENAPAIKNKKSLNVICENCTTIFIPSTVQSIVSVLDIHVNRSECVSYEDIFPDELLEEAIPDFVEKEEEE